MASRNRTEEYLALRALRTGRKPESGDSHELLEQPSHSSAIQVEAPAWFQVMQRVRTIEAQITSEFQTLEELHRNHLKVHFGPERDADAEERDIEAAAQGLSRKFKLAKGEIDKLDQVFARDFGPEGGTQTELSVLRNAKMCLVQELGVLNKIVHEGQQRYLTSLGKQRDVRDRFAGGAVQKEVEKRMAHNAQVDEYRRRGCTQEQIDSIMINTRMADEQNQEFQKILSNIKDLNQIFSDLQTLVVEQGTLLDRIDHNMTVTHTKVVEGKKQLLAAQKHQKAGSFQLCVLLLIVMIVGFALALMIKITT